MRLQALRTPLAADPQRPPATAKDATSGRGKWSLLRCPECRLNLVSVDAVKIHFSSHHLPPPLLPNYFHPRPAGQLLPHLLRLSIASRDCSRRSAVRPASSCGKGRQSAREKKVKAGASESAINPPSLLLPAPNSLAAWGAEAELQSHDRTLACLFCILRTRGGTHHHHHVGGALSGAHETSSPASLSRPCHSLLLPRVTLSLVPLLSPRVLTQMWSAQASRRTFPCHRASDLSSHLYLIPTSDS